jgi:hypothetical protein
MTAENIVEMARACGRIPDAVVPLITVQLVRGSSGEMYDEHQDFRFQVTRELYRTLRPTDRTSAQFLLKQEIEAHRGAWSVHDSIVLCAGILFELGQPEDALLIWEAKRATWDTDCSIPIGLLVGAGVDRTLHYWRSQSSPEANDFIKFVTEAAYAGEFGEIQELRSEMKGWLHELASG